MNRLLLNKLSYFTLALILIPSLILAADFHQGLTEFNNKNYPQAYKIWIEVANKQRQLSDSLEWQSISQSEKTNAQYGIGLLYWLGKGVKQDYGLAEQWLKKAAMAGDKQAALKLGVLYFEGLAGKKDLAQAQTWLLKSAKAGQVEAQYNLGLLFLQGLLGKKNLTQAKYWFTQAANQGDLAAKQELSLLLANKPSATNTSVPQAVIAKEKPKPIVQPTVVAIQKLVPTPKPIAEPITVVATQKMTAVSSSQPIEPVATEAVESPAEKAVPKALPNIVEKSTKLSIAPLILTAQVEKTAEPLPTIVDKSVRISSKTVAAEKKQLESNQTATVSISENQTDIAKTERSYLIQIAALSDKANLDDLLQRYPSNEWRVDEKLIRHKKIYLVSRCCFVSKELAAKATQTLPSALQKLRPKVLKNQH